MLNEESFLLFYFIYLWPTRTEAPVTYLIQFLVLNVLALICCCTHLSRGRLFEESIDSLPIFNLGLMIIKRSLHLIFDLPSHSKKTEVFWSDLYYLLRSWQYHDLFCFIFGKKFSSNQWKWGLFYGDFMTVSAICFTPELHLES